MRRRSLHAVARSIVGLIVATTMLAAGTPVDATEVEVPIDIGLGPTAIFLQGPLGVDEPVHWGLRLSVAAVIDDEWVAANRRRIPSKYRKYADNVDEIRVRPFPLILVPDTLILSPPQLRGEDDGTAIWGATWRPFAVGLTPIKEPFRLGADIGLLATYAFIDAGPGSTADTHFLRPGVDIRADLELPLAGPWALTFGGGAQFWVPQALGGSIGELPADDEPSLWRGYQAYATLHYRFDFAIDL